MIENLFDVVKQTISGQMENDFLAGGLILGFMTTIAMSLRSLPGKLWILFINRFTTNVYLDSTQDTYQWVHIWMSHQNFGKKARRISIRVKSNDIEEDVAVGEPSSVDKNARSKIVFSLGEGNHFVRYSGKWLFLNLAKERPQGGGGRNFVAVYESITIRYFGTKRDILEDIVNSAVDLVTPDDENYIDMYMYDGYSNWNRLKRRSGRDPGTLMYQDGLFDSLHRDIVEFKENYQWYVDRGIPYKKTFLLHGPPGSGKTSMALALSTALKSSLYTMDLSSGSAEARSLIGAFHNIQKNSIVLIEDIHTVGSKKKDSDGEELFHLSVEGLTNVLDGALSAEGVILILTTNYPELLDERLVRPGRIDRRVFIGNADRYQIEKMALKFYPEANGEIREFSSMLEDGAYSMAQLQEYFIRTSLPDLIKNRDSLDSLQAPTLKETL